MTRLFLILFILFSLIATVIFTSCGVECGHVEPCFSYMPLEFEILIVDKESGELIPNLDASSSINVDLNCNNSGTNCFIRAIDQTNESNDREFLLVLTAPGYESSTLPLNVGKESDMSSGGCTVNGCPYFIDPPQRVELIKLESIEE